MSLRDEHFDLCPLVPGAARFRSERVSSRTRMSPDIRSTSQESASMGHSVVRKSANRLAPDRVGREFSKEIFRPAVLETRGSRLDDHRNGIRAASLSVMVGQPLVQRRCLRGCPAAHLRSRTPGHRRDGSFRRPMRSPGAAHLTERVLSDVRPRTQPEAPMLDNGQTVNNPGGSQALPPIGSPKCGLIGRRIFARTVCARRRARCPTVHTSAAGFSAPPAPRGRTARRSIPRRPPTQ